MNLHDKLGTDLAAINRLLRSVVETDSDLPRPSVVRDSVLKLIDAGGKRLRPLMVIVGSRYGKEMNDSLVLRTAVMLEYLHMASLVHDDIIDQSDMRRGEPTLHAATDIRTAVHVGNYMIARAMEWAAGKPEHTQPAEAPLPELREEDAYRLAELAAMVTELCMGEYDQLHNRFNYDMTLEQYLSKTRFKTALFMAHCLKAGADAAQADPDTAQLLFDFGESLGMAFQIQDDLLDFTHTRETIGKPAGADLRSGNVTLPVIFALEDPSLAPSIRQLDAHAPSDVFGEVVSRIAGSPAIPKCRALARQYGEQACRIMDRLQGHPAQGDLRILAEYFLQ